MHTTGKQSFLDALNHEYVGLHTAKEDAFWTAMMGLADDARSAQQDLDQKEIALQRFLRDPERLHAVQRDLERVAAHAPDGIREIREIRSLEGWLETFRCHVIESPAARALAEETVALEGRLARARSEMRLGYVDANGAFVEASSVKLSVMLRSEANEPLRRAAWNGLRSIETYVLENGFLEILRARNRLGRMLGCEDYYDWKTRRVERMSKADVFAHLDELEARTRERARESLAALVSQHGSALVQPWNVSYLISGDTTREQDPYFPFSAAIERWGRSFAAMGIDYKGAQLTLDLIDRKGKYENGFMHGPEVAWRDQRTRHRARIHFTANAIPGMLGSGQRALETLFHEGGHAAHFANIDMPAPCFGQEFAPTSVGFSETQSMFLDSLLSDADWKRRYALDPSGRAMPWELIERGVRRAQPFAAWQARAMLSVCYAERALYGIPDDELTAERVLSELREVERRLLFLEQGSPRPVLAVPHLLSDDSSAYYHGYVMAEMAVEQTRDFFRARDGHIVDNPRIGPDLEAAYWRPGNSLAFDDFLRRLTGEGLAATGLAARLNRSVDEALADARGAVDALAAVPRHTAPIDLGASIRVAHGRETVAELNGDFESFAADFARWIEAHSSS
jgi:hypothetical protein